MVQKKRSNSGIFSDKLISIVDVKDNPSLTLPSSKGRPGGFTITYDLFCSRCADWQTLLISSEDCKLQKAIKLAKQNNWKTDKGLWVCESCYVGR